MKKTVLVTGGAGFIGAALTRRLLEMGLTVDIIDDLSTGFKSNIPQGARFIKGNLCNPSSLDSLDFAQYSTVFHLAAQSSGERSFENPSVDIGSNFSSTAWLLEKSLRVGVQHFLFASSMGVYGKTLNQPVNEETPCMPISFYGANKLASEHYCRIYGSLGLNITAFRMFNVYGPGQNMDNMKQGMLSIYLSFLLKNEIVHVKGSLDRYRDFIYIDDVTSAWLAAYQNPNAYGKTYNLGSGNKTTISQLLEMLIQACKGRKAEKSDYEFLQGTPGDQHGMVADINRICAEIQWKPQVLLEKGITKMVEWAKNR
jgi:UDP-glucose 4-epimerase